MSESDVARHSTKGKPRAICIGGKVLKLSSEPNQPIIDVKQLPPISAVCLQLATINRFNGATTEPYSVAQHSCFVASLIFATRPDLELPALLHDLPEIVYGDIVTGVKHSVGMVLTRFTEQIDNLVLNHYLGRFGFRYPLPEADHAAIKTADEFALVYEAQSLLPVGSRPSDSPENWPATPQEIQSPFVCQPRQEACQNMIDRIKLAISRVPK